MFKWANLKIQHLLSSLLWLWVETQGGAEKEASGGHVKWDGEWESRLLKQTGSGMTAAWTRMVRAEDGETSL